MPATAEAGATLSDLTVVVRDDRGNAMAGQPLTVTVVGGTLTGAPAATEAGPTRLGAWTINRSVGPNTLTVASGRLTPVTVAVQGVAGAPAQMTTTTPTAATAVVGQAFPFTLRLADANGNPTAGTVQLAVTAGTLSALTASADTSGNVATPTWTLPHTTGETTLTATVGATSIRFSVSAHADQPAAIRVLAGDGQTAYAGVAVSSPIRLSVSDQYGNPTPNIPVSFRPTAGGGAVANNGTATTDATGIVTAPAWSLGKRVTAQQLTATAGSATQTVSAAVVPGISIDVRFVGPMTDAQKAPFLGAVERLRATVLAGTGPYPLTSFNVAGHCGLPGAGTITENVSGIIIYVTVDSIDGRGKILGQSGPCALRSSAMRYLPVVAEVEFDQADFDPMITGGYAEDVATHEMMHSLGLGTLWFSSLKTGQTDVDPRFIGPAAVSACIGLNGTNTCAAGVPIENTGGSGTAGAHWRKTTFLSELMTGWISVPSVMSTISIASLQDLGYTVNLSAADPFVVAGGLRIQSTRGATPAAGWEMLRTIPSDPGALELSGGAVVVRPERLKDTIHSY